MGTMTKGSRELSYNIYIRNPSSTTTTNGVCMSVFVCLFVIVEHAALSMLATSS